MPEGMELPILKPIKHFSPTAYMIADGCEYSYYVQRVGDMGLPQFKQTEAMAAGSAFDSFVKAEIAHSLGMPDQLATLLESVDDNQHSVIPAGRKLFEFYKQCGAYQSLIDEGIAHIEMTVKAKDYNGVILYCKPDMQQCDGRPLDWKVNGYASAYGVYPKKGFSYKFDGQRRIEGTGRSMLLEDIDRKWAIQLLFYNWALDNTGPYFGAIDQIACKDDKIQVACFRNAIGRTFADKLWRQVKDKWNRFQKGIFLVPEPSDHVCKEYNRVKDCANACHFYQEKEKKPVSLRDTIGRR